MLLFRDDGKTHYGTSSDIWAVGVLVFQIWTNEHFASEREVHSSGLAHVINSRIATIAEEGMQSMLHGFLKKDPRHRLKTKELLDHNFLQMGKSVYSAC